MSQGQDTFKRITKGLHGLLPNELDHSSYQTSLTYCSQKSSRTLVLVEAIPGLRQEHDLGGQGRDIDLLIPVYTAKGFSSTSRALVHAMPEEHGQHLSRSLVVAVSGKIVLLDIWGL